MLRRIKDGVKYYIQHTDLLLMVLALVICLFGLVLIWSGSQPQAKVNPDRVMMVQCIGIGVGFVGLVILSLMDFDRFPWLWIIMAVFNVLFQFLFVQSQTVISDIVRISAMNIVCMENNRRYFL